MMITHACQQPLRHHPGRDAGIQAMDDTLTATANLFRSGFPAPAWSLRSVGRSRIPGKRCLYGPCSTESPGRLADFSGLVDRHVGWRGVPTCWARDRGRLYRLHHGVRRDALRYGLRAASAASRGSAGCASLSRPTGYWLRARGSTRPPLGGGIGGHRDSRRLDPWHRRVGPIVAGPGRSRRHRILRIGWGIARHGPWHQTGRGWRWIAWCRRRDARLG
jgi:hypothetical protein